MKQSIGACQICGCREFSVWTRAKDWWMGTRGRYELVQCLGCSLLMLKLRSVDDVFPHVYPFHYPPHQEGGIRHEEIKIKTMWRQALKKRLFEEFYFHRFDGPRHMLRQLWRGFLRLLLLSPRIRRNILYFPDKMKILDVGCGNGNFLRYMRSLGWETKGVERNALAANFCQKTGLVVQCCDILQAVFPRGEFDVVTMWEVIEHLADPLEVLSRVRKLLRRGGMLVLSTPNTASVMAVIFRRWWFNADVPRHLFLYSPSTIRQLLRLAGFRVVQLDFDSSTSGLLGSLEHYLRFKSGLSLERDEFRKNRLYGRLVRPLVRLIDLVWLGDGMRIYAISDR